MCYDIGNVKIMMSSARSLINMTFLPIIEKTALVCFVGK